MIDLNVILSALSKIAIGYLIVMIIHQVYLYIKNR